MNEKTLETASIAVRNALQACARRWGSGWSLLPTETKRGELALAVLADMSATGAYGCDGAFYVAVAEAALRVNLDAT